MIRRGAIPGLVLATVVAACSSLGSQLASPSTGADQVLETPTLEASIGAASPSPAPSQSPAPSPSPAPSSSESASPPGTGLGPSPTGEWWVEPGAELDNHLEPLPSDAPPAKVSREEAVKAAAKEFLGSDQPPDVVEHGLGEISYGVWRPVWLIVIRYTNPQPHPISGPCCTAHWATTDWAGVMISDQTGKFLRSFSRGTSVDPPATPGPAASTDPPHSRY